MCGMSESTLIQGRLVSLNWPKTTSDATLAFDTSQRQIAKAEIEDASGVTHHVEVLVHWDSDYLVGKEVSAKTTDEGTMLSEIS
jgi:hypothetical protein